MRGKQKVSSPPGCRLGGDTNTGRLAGWGVGRWSGGGVVNCQSCRINQVRGSRCREFLQTSQLSPNSPEKSGLKDFADFLEHLSDWLVWIRNVDGVAWRDGNMEI